MNSRRDALLRRLGAIATIQEQRTPPTRQPVPYFDPVACAWLAICPRTKVVQHGPTPEKAIDAAIETGWLYTKAHAAAKVGG